jgi:hypothetical protein
VLLISIEKLAGFINSVYQFDDNISEKGSNVRPSYRSQNKRGKGPLLAKIASHVHATGVRFGHIPVVARLNLKVGFLVTCRSNHDPKLLLPARNGRSSKGIYWLIIIIKAAGRAQSQKILSTEDNPDE